MILPGVGAFGDAAANLRRAGFEATVARRDRRGERPLLGICVGMQLLFDESEEMGCHAGLGVIPGQGGALRERDARARTAADGQAAEGAADRLEPAPPHRGRSVAGRCARRRVRVFRPLLLLRAGGPDVYGGEH